MKNKPTCLQCETVEIKGEAKWCSIECKETFFQKYYDEKVPCISLDLRRGSWENLFECIKSSKIKAKGNFWASVQHLEFQFKGYI